MRLLRSSSIEDAVFVEFAEFFGSSVPPYAILSHTWGSEEVTYDDLKLRQNVSLRSGYRKIINCCRQAVLRGLEYVWIDTCCIDKSSSAELSEAINSMYEWYAKATTCFVYMPDVDFYGLTFERSKWFTRGWTLQELIAPKDILFFTTDKWSFLGTKEHLLDNISRITGIDTDVLLDSSNIATISIAKRMSWAAKRMTTRPEDLAYCLLGIFGVNMPLLYGEGTRAFIRLQEEIIRISDDQSLFAWMDCTNDDTDIVYGELRPLGGLLASSPAQFAQSANIVPYRNWKSSVPYAMTNQGLRIELPMYKVNQTGLCIGILCCRYNDDSTGPLAVHLRPLWPQREDQEQFARCRHQKTLVIVEHIKALKATMRTIYVRNRILLPSINEIQIRHGFLLRQQPDLASGYQLSRLWPLNRWNASQRCFQAPTRKAAFFFTHKNKDGPNFVVMVRADLTTRNQGDPEIRCTCKIRADETDPESDVITKEYFQYESMGNPSPWMEALAKSGAPKTFVDIGKSLRVVAEVKREMFLGEDVFPVDISVKPSSFGPFELP